MWAQVTRAVTAAQVAARLTRSAVGARLYPQTAAEVAAAVTPTDYAAATIDVTRFGAVGDGVTDDTAAIQAAFNAAKRGRSRVHFPARNLNGQTVYCCHGISVWADTTITADAGVIVEKNGGAAFSHIFDCVSALGAATALTANAAKQADSVAVTSAAGLAVGQLVIIRDATYKFATSGRNLELNEIASIVGLTVTLKNRLIGAYTTAATAELLPATDPVRGVRFQGVQCRIPAGGTGGAFYFQESYNCDVIDCGSDGQEDQGGVQTWRSAYIRVTGGTFRNGQDQSTPGSGYGISIGEASHHCVVRGATMTNVRENAVGLNARHCKFVDCIAVGVYDSGFNSHANGAEDCEFIGCKVYSSRAHGFVGGFTGSNAADKRIRFVDCIAYDCGDYGFWSGADLGRENEDIEFINCTAVRPGVTNALRYGFLVSRSVRPKLINCRVVGGSGNVRAGVMVELCTGALVRGGEVRDVPNGWGVIHDQCTGIEVAGVEFRAVSAAGVHATGTASTRVRVADCRSDADLEFTRNAGDIHERILYATKRTEARGVASVADGATIAHGLGRAPVGVVVTSATADRAVSANTFGATTFTVNINKNSDGTADGAANSVSWYAWW